MPCGTTGESPTLSHEEHMRVIEICVEEADGPGAGDRRRRLQFHRRSHRAAPATPRRWAPTRCCRSPAITTSRRRKAVPPFHGASPRRWTFPILLYNIPGRAIVEIRVETMARLSKHPEHHRRQGRHRQSDAADARARGLRQGLAADLRRGRHRAGLHGPWRPWLHLGDGQCRAQAVRRVPGRLPAGRLTTAPASCRTS